MGPAIPEPIAYRDLLLWAEANDYADLDLLQRCVAAMDRVFLAQWLAEEQQRQAREAARGGRRGR